MKKYFDTIRKKIVSAGENMPDFYVVLSQAQENFLADNPQASYWEVENLKLNNRVLSIEEYRAARITELSALSLQKNNELCPDYKLKNALIAVYDETTNAEIIAESRRIGTALRDHYYELKEAIEKATTTGEIDQIFESNNFNSIE